MAGTFDTKGEELRFIADIIKATGLPVKLVDLSTTGLISGADVPPLEIALQSPWRFRWRSRTPTAAPP